MTRCEAKVNVIDLYNTPFLKTNLANWRIDLVRHIAISLGRAGWRGRGRARGKARWLKPDREIDRIRRQVATIVDQALKAAEESQRDRYDGDQVRETVASALKEMFKDNRNIASQQTPEQARAAQQGGGAVGTVTSSPQLEAQIARMEAFLIKAESVLTQLQVAAKRVAAGGGGGGFAPRRMSHIPKPRSDEQNSVLLEIFKSNVKLRENLARARAGLGPESAETAGEDAPADAEEAAPTSA